MCNVIDRCGYPVTGLEYIKLVQDRRLRIAHIQDIYIFCFYTAGGVGILPPCK